ncbi:hypothetical protein G6L63_06140 [Agrobacterium vitis]|uniref:hypothetical protein n=1 Tax=Agrobacterium vitis TaxID=373 RepID=UPI0012E7BCD2|nr:hypothetical protein [Agrobacterium vitis]MUZ95184.1 hypothetical protein [Agrobacterium vitis]MVA29652.1 hypothetical protein [Agrobacterium vitis]NOJ34627.1 hypothetical protein [Agrobacterium vitis]NSZ47496.1 hypothetical protein [Agrobacterium vitis]UJL72183.1 hypothetical protein AVCG412_04685 [Agrobacterium vitis]
MIDVRRNKGDFQPSDRLDGLQIRHLDFHQIAIFSAGESVAADQLSLPVFWLGFSQDY